MDPLPLSKLTGSPIKVVMLIQGYHPLVGGAERQLAALIPFLMGCGVEVQVVTRRYPGLAPFERVNDVSVFRLPIPGPKPIAALTFILTALPLIKKLEPNVIHAHELLSPTTTAIMAKKLFKIPIVVKVLRGGSLGDLAKLKRKPFGNLRIASARKWVDVFITISEEIDKELASVEVPPSRRSFIPNGVDIERFVPVPSPQKRFMRKRLGLSEKGPVTVYSGRLSAEKRVDQLLAIWPTVRASHPDACLLILGSGIEEKLLKELAGEGVKFLGLVPNVDAYLQASDLFVLPSATEGLSNALLEALASGLPTIATSVGGAPDVIEHKVNGWLISPDSEFELQQAILTILGNLDTYVSLGNNARKTIIQKYSLQNTAERLRAMYLECLN